MEISSNLPSGDIGARGGCFRYCMAPASMGCSLICSLTLGMIYAGGLAVGLGSGTSGAAIASVT